jgi:hypothetical protein
MADSTPYRVVSLHEPDTDELRAAVVQRRRASTWERAGRCHGFFSPFWHWMNGLFMRSLQPRIAVLSSHATAAGAASALADFSTARADELLSTADDPVVTSDAVHWRSVDEPHEPHYAAIPVLTNTLEKRCIHCGRPTDRRRRVTCFATESRTNARELCLLPSSAWGLIVPLCEIQCEDRVRRQNWISARVITCHIRQLGLNAGTDHFTPLIYRGALHESGISVLVPHAERNCELRAPWWSLRDASTDGGADRT